MKFFHLIWAGLWRNRARTVLTLLALPAMYAAWFRVRRPEPQVPA